MPTLMRNGKSFSAVAILSLLTILLMAVAPFDAAAQSESASVSGRVTDQQNAVIPNAEVEMRNVDTNSTHVTKTNGDGIYSFPSLRPGSYVISVRKEQFQTVSVTGVVLNVQDNLSRNFVLQVGSSAVSVTVTADDLHINTTDASVSTVVDRNFAENLPMNGRSFQSLIQLAPGVVLVPSTASDNGQFSVNGQRAASNYWMVDGVSANIGIGVPNGTGAGNGFGGTLGSFSAMGGTNGLVSVDAMQEFRIQTSTYAPEFGRTPGGQISIVTRSGTNQFHGTAFEYLRNDVLDANNWFNTSVTPSLPKPEERQNDFGGTFSGPISKDRTFFFFSYEGLRLRLPATSLTTVPDLTARQNALASVQAFLNAYPLPNGPDNSTTGIAQFNASYSNPASLDAYSLRVDHRVNSKLNLFGRYNYSPSEIIQRGAAGIDSLSVFGTTRTTIETATVGATLAISPTMGNDVRVNYSRTDASSRNEMDHFGGAVPLTSLPFPNSFTTENAFFAYRIVPLQQGIFLVGARAHNRQRQVNVVDGLSLQKASHGLKFGVDFQQLTPGFLPPTYSQGAFFRTVSAAASGQLRSGDTTTTLSSVILLHNLGMYAQDTWRLGSRLTVTYGLRWDLDFAPSTSSGPKFAAVQGFDPNNLSAMSLAPVGTPPYSTTFGNLAPRIGVAYQLLPRSDWGAVLRSGFGVFYDLATSEVGNLLGQAQYPNGGFHPLRGTFPVSPTDAAPPPITPPGGGQGVLSAFEPHLQLPYTLQWNVALEQGLGRQQSITASYVGAEGRRLLQTIESIGPSPNFAVAAIVTNASTSDYHALQVQFQRRLSHGLQALTSYTWSHSIDTASAGSSLNMSNLLVSGAAAGANRGSSDFDIRNAFSAGVIYDIPTPRTNAFAEAILRGWSLQNTVQARSAPPVDVSDANFFQTDSGIIFNVRPDLIPGESLYLFGSRYPGGKAFNPAAFTDPPGDPSTGIPLRQGNLGRNALRGFGAFQWDFAIHRDFRIRELLKLQFRAELFNVLNHPNFGQPSGQFGGGGFGLSSQTFAQSLNGSNLGSGAFNPLYQIGGPRSIQLALKLFF